MRWRYEIAEYMHEGFVHATDDRIFANLGRKSGKRRNRWPTNRRACGTMVGRSYIRARPTIHEYHLCRHAMRVAIERRYPMVVDDILAPFPKFRSRLQIAYRLCRQSQYSDDIQIAWLLAGTERLSRIRRCSCTTSSSTRVFSIFHPISHGKHSESIALNEAKNEDCQPFRSKFEVVFDWLECCCSSNGNIYVNTFVCNINATPFRCIVTCHSQIVKDTTEDSATR